MSNTGLAGTAIATTPAPTMYKEVEQAENVARGYVEIIEIIAYDFVKEIENEMGKKVKIEKGREPYFCQDSEDAMIFSENNPKVRTETFTIQVRKSTAKKYIDSKRNMKAFEEAK